MIEETHFDRLRDLVKSVCPERLEAFDKLAHKLKSLREDDEIFLLLEMTGFFAVITQEVPKSLASQSEEAKELFLKEAEARKNLLAEIDRRNEDARKFLRDELERGTVGLLEASKSVASITDNTKLIESRIAGFVPKLEEINKKLEGYAAVEQKLLDSSRSVEGAATNIMNAQNNMREAASLYVKQSKYSWLSIGLVAGFLIFLIGVNTHWIVAILLVGLGMGWLQWMAKKTRDKIIKMAENQNYTVTSDKIK